MKNACADAGSDFHLGRLHVYVFVPWSPSSSGLSLVLCTALGPDCVDEVAADVRDVADVEADELVDEVVLVVEDVDDEAVVLLVGYALELVG
ncbi:hypothetical protein GCM10029964_009680 [Kibdelosporangium lantanae]